MTSSNVNPFAGGRRASIMILAPLSLILLALYPAIWHPDQPVRRVASTVMVVALVWVILAALATFQRSVVEIVKAQAIVELELDAMDRADWDDIVNRFSAEPPRWPRDEMY